MATNAEQVHSYPFGSFIDGPTVRLAGQLSVGNRSPCFFERRLTRPRRTADQLRTLMTVVHARHYIPPALTKKLREADPIVTASDDLLRFEGFSACCGVHGRVDVLAPALTEGPNGRGTTNVDFNPPMLAALARISARDEVSIVVSNDAVTLGTAQATVIEKQVTLPLRWLRGLVEVQTVQGRMQQKFEVDSTHAFRFLRSLPRTPDGRNNTFVESAGAGLRLSRMSRPGAMTVGGLERLRPLESLAADADRLVVFADEVTGASAWVLEFSDSRLTLTLSPGVWRGFSGEGQALTTLAAPPDALLAQVRAQLAWSNTIDAAVLSTDLDRTVDEIEAALKTLGTQGLVGFDLIAQRYFHRELPFDLTAVEDLQPRLLAARKLVETSSVKVTSSTTAGELEAFVKSADVEHRVHGAGQPLSWSCTCPWFAKHGTRRGPCKHVLATQLATAS